MQNETAHGQEGSHGCNLCKGPVSLSRIRPVCLEIHLDQSLGTRIMVSDGHFFRGAAATPLLLSRRWVCDQGRRHQESQGQQYTIATSSTATAAAPSTPPLTPFAAEGHTAKPLHPLHEEKMRKSRTDGDRSKRDKEMRGRSVK